MPDLTSRITAALDEQQRLAEDLCVRLNFSLIAHRSGPTSGRLLALADPSSVLRRVAAQRRVLERHRRDGECCVGCGRGEYGDYRELFVVPVLAVDPVLAVRARRFPRR